MRHYLIMLGLQKRLAWFTKILSLRLYQTMCFFTK